MIVFDLHCSAGHRFEGWFASSDDFARQQGRGLVTCPQCGDAMVGKAPMAPAVPKKGNQRPPAASAGTQPMANAPMPPDVAEALHKIAEMQAEALKSSTWVGGDFAEVSRAMHYGEQDQAPVHGEVSHDEAKALMEEGVPVAPILFPVAPPEKLN